MNILAFMRNFGSMGAMRIASAAMSFTFVVYIARLWGPRSLGEFSLALSYFVLLQQMPLLGLHIVLIRDIATDPAAARRHVFNAAFIALLASLVLAVAVGAAGQWLYQDGTGQLHAAMWLVGASMVPTGFICVAEATLIGQQRMHVLAGVNVAENIFRTTASLAAAYLGYGLAVIFTVFLLGRLLAAAAYFRWGELTENLDPKWLRRETIKGYVKQVPVFFGIMVFAAAINRLDFVLLSWLGTLYDTGLYSASYKLYEVGTMLPTLLMVVLFPYFAESYKASRGQFAAAFSAGVRLILLFLTPGVVLATFHAKTLMALFGPEYADAYPVLRWLMPSLIAAALIQLFSVVLVVTENQRIDCQVLAIACIAYAVMLAVAIPYLGAIGAAMSTFGVAILQVALRYHFIGRRLRLPAAASAFVDAGTAALAMSAVLYLLRAYPVLAAAAGLAAYLSLLFARRAITMQQLFRLKSFLHERRSASL